MSTETLLIGVVIEEEISNSMTQVCAQYRIPEQLLLEMIEQGLFENHKISAESFTMTPQDKRRMESAFRLHRDLGINLAGVALALDLLEELEEVRQELAILKKHF